MSNFLSANLWPFYNWSEYSFITRYSSFAFGQTNANEYQNCRYLFQKTNTSIPYVFALAQKRGSENGIRLCLIDSQ